MRSKNSCTDPSGRLRAGFLAAAAFLVFGFLPSLHAQVDGAAVVFQRKLEQVPIESFQADGKPLPDVIRELQASIAKKNPDIPINFVIPPVLNEIRPLVHLTISDSNAWDVLQMISSSIGVPFQLKGRVVIFDTPERIERNHGSSKDSKTDSVQNETTSSEQISNSKFQNDFSAEKVLEFPVLLTRNTQTPILNAKIFIQKAKPLIDDKGMVQDVFLEVQGEDRQREQIRTSLQTTDLPAFIAARYFSPLPLILKYGLVANDFTYLKDLDNSLVENGETSFMELDRLFYSQIHTARNFARVRPGFIVLKTTSHKQSGPCLAELIIPLQGKKFIGISAEDFTNLLPQKDRVQDNQNLKIRIPNPTELRQLTPQNSWVLKSPFSPNTPILSNTSGEMKNSWVGNDDGNFGPPAIIETNLGYFFGCLDFNELLSSDDFTWQQAKAERRKDYVLSKERNKRIKRDEKILELTERGKFYYGINADYLLKRRVIRNRNIYLILEKGPSALLRELASTEGDGVDSLDNDDAYSSSSISPTTRAFTETRIESVGLLFESANPSSIKFILHIKQSTREVEVTYRDRGSNTKYTEWKPQRVKEFVELPTDSDGGLRLWDGQRLIELSPTSFGDIEMNEWIVEPNSLRR